MKATLFNDQRERKSTKLINKHVIQSGKKTKYKQYVDSVIQMFITYSVKTFATVVEKPDIVVEPEDGYLPKHYVPLLKTIELYCEKENKSKSLFIYDSQHDGIDEKIARAFTNFLFKSKLGRGFDKILEIPLFASSEVTPCLQLADIAASVIRLSYTHNLTYQEPTNPFEEWISGMYKIVKSTTETIDEASTGYCHYGIYYMKKEIFQAS